METKLKKEKFGNHERVNFARVKNVLDIPYLIEVQKDSYDWFVKHGIKEVFEDFSPITDKSNHFELHFTDYTLAGKPKYDERECKERDANYALPLKVKVRLVRKQTGEMIDQEVFMGDFPLMTKNGSFIINGAERVIVSQLVRSPGVYCDKNIEKKKGTSIFGTTVIPSRGAWLEFKQDVTYKDTADNEGTRILYVSVDRTRKITSTVLLRALGFGTDEELATLFDNDPTILATCAKDTAKTEQDGLIELYKRLRPGEVPTQDALKMQLNNIFFDPKRYDLQKVGRYKFNKKLAIANRLVGNTLAEDVVDMRTGELLFGAGTKLTADEAKKIQSAGVNQVRLSVADGKTFKVIGNNTASLMDVCGIDYHEVDGLVDYCYFPVLIELVEKAGGDRDVLISLLKENVLRLCTKHILIEDIVSIVSYNLGLIRGIGSQDNIDHLGNRRVKAVGELLQNQFRIGISRLERVIRERMTTQEQTDVTPQSLINVRPVSSAIKEFFGSSQLSQFMDQNNPIAELTHKRKLSALGPGGLNRERATFDVRDVHHSHYGRMCPIETPEGQNIGLITSLTSFARINEYGFIETAYRRVDKDTHFVSDEIDYLTADEEDAFTVAQAREPLNEEGCIAADRVIARRREEIIEVGREEIDYVDVSPKQMVSIATALIPFLENDDTNRALMGSNMQRQAVPLLKPEAPCVATGVEAKIAMDSGVMIVAERDGVVMNVSADAVKVKYDDGEIVNYETQKFIRSNQGTCVNQKPVVNVGQRLEKGQVICDGPATENGELALGRNIMIGFMEWEGYNYEDAILISEKLVRDDVLTSIHIEEYEIEARDTRLGTEEITRDIPNQSEDSLKNLDEDGIIRVGAEVKADDILVGKVTPKGETELSPEERLLRAIFGDKAKEVRDTSLKVPHGGNGIIVDVKIFTRENKDELSPGVNKLVRVYIAQKRKISIGDKMAGRHGNKGVISRVMPQEDMPFMADGTPLEILLNPLGVPSRMNIGQVLEVHLGLVAKALGIKVATPVFDGATEGEIKSLLEENGFVNDLGKADGKVQLYDGRTGEPFENRVTVGQMYMLKLHHLVDDKIHARSVGPYSLVTQQPLGGKAQFGGQRFGEMEVWALEAYGAGHILQEIMTVKSDDVVGRVKTYESIVKGSNVSEPGIPESFKVLIKELQALALDIKVLTEDRREITIKELAEDADDMFEPETAKEQIEEDEENEVDIFDDFDSEFEDGEDDDFDDYDDSAFEDLFEDDEI